MALTTKPPRVIYLPEIAEPPTPGSGVVLYNATGGILSVKDENGVVQSVGSPSAVGESNYKVLTAFNDVATWNDSTILVGVNGGATNRAHTIDVVQTGIDLTMAGGVAVLTLAEGGGGGGAGTVDIEDEGVPEGAADTIDFVGDGVSVTFASGKATVSIASGGSGSFPYFPTISTPVKSSFTTYNGGLAASTDESDGILMSLTGTGGNSVQAAYVAAPATPWTVTLGMIFTAVGTNYHMGGIFLGKNDDSLISYGPWWENETVFSLKRASWSSATASPASVISARPYSYPMVTFLRATDDGTGGSDALKFWWSANGKDWIRLVALDALTSTATRLGFWGNCGNSLSQHIRIIHWAVT